MCYAARILFLKLKRWRAERRISHVYEEIERLRELARDGEGWDARQYIEIQVGLLLEELGSARAELAMLRARQEFKRRKGPRC